MLISKLFLVERRGRVRSNKRGSSKKEKESAEERKEGEKKPFIKVLRFRRGNVGLATKFLDRKKGGRKATNPWERKKIPSKASGGWVV